MPEQGVAGAAGYRAFISYSHRDDAVAKTLHRRLETYRLPKKLIGSQSERGPIPARLTPIFRDLDELSAADDLSVEIKAALARSEALIILCSPAAKASKWVNLEIETFRALHGTSRPVLAALIEGEPADAFPSALIADGQEPVAADFRKGGDGKRLALLKLVAGITGAPLDALVQRDAQRQNRRVMAITGGALAAALTMALLLVIALRSQAEAERQRAEAEGLVEYMLTDLRDRLKGVGRLDVMTAVNERAMRYYGGQEALEGLPLESLERRARILHAMGEDDEKRGNLKLALMKFEEAHRTTAAILLKNPVSSSAIFAHAQSEYWIGYIAYQNNNRTETRRRFNSYKSLSDQLVAMEPNNNNWLRESGYAEGALCSFALDEPVNPKLAIDTCKSALIRIQTAVKNSIADRQSQEDIANRHAWLADAWKVNGNINLALQNRLVQEKIIHKLLLDQYKDTKLHELWIRSQIKTAELFLDLDNLREYNVRIDRAKSSYNAISIIDKGNFRVINLKKLINDIILKKELKYG